MAIFFCVGFLSSYSPGNNDVAPEQFVTEVEKTPVTITDIYKNPVPGSVFGTSHWDGKRYAIDMREEIGTPIYASSSGVVIASGWGKGASGIRVIIKDRLGVYALYCHMSNTNVTKGERVRQGQLIGWVGMTGHTTGPHLHFELMNVTNPQFPKPWLVWRKQRRT